MATTTAATLPDDLTILPQTQDEWESLLGLLPEYDPFADTTIPGVGECWFDPDAATRIIEFYHEELKHVEGSVAGKPFILQRWQQSLFANIFGWKRPDGTRRYREVFIYVPKKSGKMMDLDTPLPTPTGWTTIGDVEVGDTLFDEHGLPCRVVAVHPVDPSPKSYRIRFSNGEQAVACADHLWLTTALVAQPGVRGCDGGDRRLTRIRTTQEIYDTRKSGKINNHRMAMPDALHCPAIRLPLDPYVLGCWLGDGDSDCARLTCHGDDVPHFREQFNAAGYDLDPKLQEGKGGGHVYRSRIYRTQEGLGGVAVQVGKRHPWNANTTLARMGLFHNKHIPTAYLRASISQRLALLQGLLDTDGYADAKQIEFVTVLPALRDGVMELLASLGIKARCAVSRSRCNGKDHGEKYRITFFMSPDTMPVFRLPRKLQRLDTTDKRVMGQRSRTVQISEIEPCAPVPMRCITVDSPSGLYRFGRSMLYTHNTPSIGGLVPYLLCCDGEAAPQVYSVASDLMQAALIYKHAAGMIRQNADLKELCRVYGNDAAIGQKVVFCESNGGVYRVLPYTPDSQQGLIPHAVLVDELHAHPDDKMYRSMKSAFVSENRKQPLFLTITTADYDREGSVCNELLAYAKSVRDGSISDPTFLPAVWELGRDEDWGDENNWRKVNPNIGVSVSLEALRGLYRRAKQTPSLENDFRRYYLNQQTTTDIRSIDVAEWDACAGDVPPDSELAAYPCWAGLDLSATRDLTAMAVVWRLPGPLFVHRCYVWVPGEAIRAREDSDRVPYSVWERQGHIERMGEATVDYDKVLGLCLDLAARFQVQEFVIDPAFATQLAHKLGVVHAQVVVPLRQTYPAMTPCVQTFDRLVVERRIIHAGSPVMRWAIGNVVLTQGENDTVKPSKKKSTQRIDPYTATIMALYRASVLPESEGCGLERLW